MPLDVAAPLVFCLACSLACTYFSVNTMLRHPGQSSGGASRLGGDSKEGPTCNNIIMRLSDATSTAGTTQQQQRQAPAAATLAPAQMDVSTATAAVSEPKPIDHCVVLPEEDGAANVPIANRNDLSLFSPLHVLPAVAALVEPSPPTAAPGTSHIVTPTNDDSKLSAAPRLRHPGAPLPRRVSDSSSSSSSSNEDKLDLPTTDESIIITTTINNKRGEDADDLVLVGETNTTVQEGGFCFHSDGSFSIVESPKTTAMKPKAAKTNGEKIRDNTSDNKSKAGEDEPTKKKSAKTNKKTPTSAVTCAETKKGSGRFAVRVRFPGVGRRNVGTYHSLDEMAYAKGCASRKHRQLNTSDDAFATKEAVEEAIEAIRAYVKQALADRQKALDMQALIQKKREVKNLIVKTKSCSPSPPALERQDSRDNMKDILPTGIKLLPSGKYEVAIFFLVGERRIGVYDSLSAAVVANDAATTTLRSYLLKRSIMRGAIPGPSDSELALESAIAAANAKVASLERPTAPTLPLKKRLLERNRQELSLPFKKRFIEESTGMPQTAAGNVEQDKLLPLKKRLLRAVPVSDLAPATPSDTVYLDGAGPNDDDVVGNSKDNIAYLDRIKPDKESEDTTCMIGGSIVPGGREFGAVGWQSFPARLMQMLSSSTCTKNIGADFVWSPDGLSFVCTDPGKLVTSANSVQFFNDLYMFGFEQNSDGSYFHPLFRRDHPQLCLSISGAGRTSRGTSYRPFSENWSGANGIYYDVLIPRVDPMDGTSWFGFNLQKLDRHGWPRILGNHGPWLRDGDVVVDVNGQPMYSTIPRFVGYRCALPGGLLMPTYIQEALPFPLESVLNACCAAKPGYPLKMQIFRPNASHQASL